MYRILKSKKEKSQVARAISQGQEDAKTRFYWDERIHIAVIFHLFNIGVSSFSLYALVINSITLVTLLTLDN